MALTNLNTNWAQGSYSTNRDYYIKSEENPFLYNGNTRYLAPYYDGSIAIGYGFDLVVHSDAEINQFFTDAGLGITLSDTDKSLLAAARAYRSASRANPPTISQADLKTALTYISSQLDLDLNLGSEPNAVKLLDTYINQKAESQVSAFLKKWNGSDWGACRERIALISLAYNGGTGLLTKNIGMAIASGNHAEAWFDIRYGLNGSGNYTNRRYREADVFGLYSGTTDPAQQLNEAKDAYRMFNLHRSDILNYEIQYPLASSLTDPLTGQAIGPIQSQLKSATDLLNTDYGQGQTFDYLHIFTGDASATAMLDKSKIDRATDAQGDLIIGGSGSDTLVGSASGNDVLVAGTGNDSLKGGAGDDTLVSGAGNDTLDGGAGVNKYIFNTSPAAPPAVFGTTPAQSPTVTIEDSTGQGTIWVGGIQLGTITPVAGQDNTWTDANNTQYKYDTGTRQLTISGGSLAGAGGTIIIDNFDLNAAQQQAGYLGIHFKAEASISAGSNDPFHLGNYNITDQALNVLHGAEQTFTVAVSEIKDVAQTLILKADSAISSLLKLITGADTLSFASDGTIQITIPAGQDSVTLALLDTSGHNSADSATLTTSFTDAGGTITSNQLAVTFDSPGAAALASVTADNVITDSTTPDSGLVTLTQYLMTVIDPGNDIINLGGKYQLDVAHGGNDTINGTSGVDWITIGNRNDVINLNGGRDMVGGGNYTFDTTHSDSIINGGGGSGLILLGNGNNQFYADKQTDLGTALANQKTATASGQQGYLIGVGSGNNTIVGGGGNDAVFAGTGNNTIVCGAGSNVVIGGVTVTEAAYMWNSWNTLPTTTHAEMGGASDLVDSQGVWQPWVVPNLVNPAVVYLGGVLAASDPFSAPANYHGSTFNDVPVGAGNDTIFGGKGNSYYFLSNGDNWLDAGGGNDYIHAGAGHNTIFGGTGNDVIFGAGGSNSITLESGSDYVLLQGGNNTVVGGTGDNVIVSGDAGTFASSMSSETGANNYIYGGSGNTIIVGSGGNDTLISGSESGTGKSTYIEAGNGNEYVVGGAGNDTILGGAGSDTIDAGDGNTFVQLSTSASETSTVFGGKGTDTILGGAGTDEIYAGDGNTYVQLSTSASEISTVYGGNGSDTIVGGAGTDVLYAGDGGTSSAVTQVWAGSGASTIYGGAGVQQLIGGSGTNLIIAGDGSAYVQLSTSANETSTVYGGGSTDTIVGGAGTDVIYAGDGGTATNFTQVWVGSGTSSIYGGAGVDQIVGGSGADTLMAGSGSGTLYGGSGTDVMYSSDNYTVVAGSGSDTIYGGSGTDILYGGSGTDLFIAGSGTETIQGGGGSNTFEMDAGFGNIQLYNNSSADTLNFGAGITQSDLTTTSTLYYMGNGLYMSSVTIADAQGGTVTFQGGMGQLNFADGSTATLSQLLSPSYTVGATTYSTVSATAGAGITTLDMTGSADVTATANSLNDVISANSGNDTLVAGSGNDTLISGGGANTYVINAGSGITTINQSGTSDVLSYGTGISAANLAATAAVNADGSTTVTILDPVVINNYTAGVLDMIVFADGSTASLSAVLAQATTGSTAATSAVSVTLADGIQNMTLTGTGNLTATGNSIDDVITANSGNDTLIAGGANDTLVGGGGTATYVVNAGDNVTIANSGSADTLVFGTGILKADLTATSAMVNGVQVVTIADSQGGTVTIRGGGLNQMSFADVSTATLSQLLVMTSAVSVVMPDGVTRLILTGSANISGTGNNLNDVITANNGNDTLVAGSGLATLIGGAGNDTFVINNAGDVIQAQSTGTNTNTVQTSVSYVAPANVQNLTGTGSGNLTLTGNGLNNVITANSGNDTLIAGSGVATLVGGTGNDTFVIDNAGDVIQAQSTGTNTNTVQTSVSYVTPANVQNITGTGTGNMYLYGNNLNNVITANSGNDTLVAGSGLATLIGGSGGDLFVINNTGDVINAQPGGNNLIMTTVSYVLPANVQSIIGAGFGNLSLTGNDLNNVIVANSGNDTLVAGSGLATLVGGSGNDTFAINNAGDVIQAQSSGTNINTVQTTMSYVLPANLQNLTGSGTDNLALTGNALNNVITANSGNDTLIAGVGLATLVGGAGNDTFVINNAGDVIQAQSAGTNTNTVQTSVSYALPANVQNITGTGTGNLTLTGNSLNNVITANNGADNLIAGSGNATLVSGTGVDTLVGGTGSNIFVVQNAADVVTAQAAATLNTIQSSVSFTASANVGDLILTGTANLTATGNSGNDLIVGNSGADTLIGGSGTNVLQGGTGNATMTALAGTSALLGGAGADTITGGKGGDFIAGGNGNDTITLGGTSVVAFNTGNGQDTIIAGKSRSNTLSLGGGINYSDLAFSKSGNDLILSTSGTDSITFQNWYGGKSQQEFATLQVLEQASSTYNPGSTNVLYNQKIEEFDFSKLVSTFNAALAATPTLTSWSLMNSMLTDHLSGSDTAALGGDLAYYEGVNGNLTGMDFAAAASTLQSHQFGSKPQTIDAWGGISAGNNSLR